jgi:uncharacterized membrane protein
MAEISASSLNPFGSIDLGGKLGTFGSIAMVIAIVVVILALVGALIYWNSIKKKYWIRIHVYRLIGNVPTRTAIFSAREVNFGMAGDKLWRVCSEGWNKMKVIKWLPVGKIQTAPREFWYYIREDGEWINFQMNDLNKISREMGIKFVNEDMRLQRLATERLLEQRLLNKSFWEKWGTTIMMVIVFLVVAICMVIIFYQFGKIQDQQFANEQVQLETSKILLRVFGENFISETLNKTSSSWEANSGLIPA